MQAWSPRSATQDVDWLRQCCTSLAEQLRIAGAKNAELQACHSPRPAPLPVLLAAGMPCEYNLTQ